MRGFVSHCGKIRDLRIFRSFPGLFDRILKLFPKFVECVPAGNTACTEMNHCIKRT